MPAMPDPQVIEIESHLPIVHNAWTLISLVADPIESGTIKIDSARKAYTSSSDDVAKDSKHGNTAVLDLHRPQTVEPLLVHVLHKPDRVLDMVGTHVIAGREKN